MYAKKEDYENSIKCYTQALEVDSNHKDALVARGAAYANQEKYELAIKDFDDALKIDPNDKNAKSYLSATRDQFEKSRKIIPSTPLPISTPTKTNTTKRNNIEVINLIDDNEPERKHKKHKKEKRDKKHKSK